MYDYDNKSELDKKIDQIKDWFSYFRENNERGRELKVFLMGDQWDDKAQAYYATHNKVPMVVNKLYAFVMQLIGENRQVSPNLKVIPAYYNEDDEAVSKEIELVEDIVKSVAYGSKSDVVYETAYKNQLIVGYGAILVYTEYRNENSFDQEIKLLAIDEPECCYFDPSAKELDKSDGEYCGIISRISKNEFKEKYPNIDVADIKSVCMTDRDSKIEWIDENTVCIADHYYKEWKKKKICKLNDGDTVDKDEVDKILRDRNKRLKMMQQAEMLAEAQGQRINLTNGLDKIKIVDERTTSYCEIKHCRLTRNEILEEDEWPSKFLPLVFVDGDSYHVGGEQFVRPFIQFAVDTQKFINYCATETISYIKGGRKERFLATTANVENHQNAWKGVDNDNLALLYDPDTRTNQPPIAIQPLEIPQTLLQQYQRAEYDLYTILGRYESNVGAKGNEVSGVAIANRVKQGNVTALVYPDNLLRSQNQVGRIILDLIPTIYDTYRNVIINKEGVGKKTIEINKQVEKDKYENRIERKDYEIDITGGSSFAMQKSEAYSQLMDLIARIPAFGNIIPDLAAENLELSNTPKIVERAREYLIPQIAMKEQGKEPPPPKEDPQAVLMKSMAQSENKKADASLMSAQSRMIKAQADLKKDFSKDQADKIKASAEVGKASLQYQQEVIKTDNAKLERENKAMRDILNLEE